MSVSNLFREAALRWYPDADAISAPEGTLLRADNLVPDAEGSLELRQGSSKIYTGLGSTVHSLYTSVLSANSEQVTPADTTVVMTGVDDSVYQNGSSLITGITGTSGEDISFGDDSRQVFFARGTTKKKYDGANLWNWSIARPTGKVTLSAVTSTTSTVADFNDSESPACTVLVGNGTVGGESDADGNANEATQVTPNTTKNRAIIQRLWTSDQDFFNIANIDGTETDLFDFYLKLENPRDLKQVKIVFGLGDSNTLSFKDDRFEAVFVLDGVDIQIKDPVSEGYGAYEEAVLRTLREVLPSEITGIRSPNEVRNTLRGVGSTPSTKTTFPPDDTWSHLTISRGQFKRIGNTADRGWNTVRGFMIVFDYKSGKSSAVTVADATIIGGGDRALNGTYRCVVQGCREMQDNEGNVIYYQLSPPSEASDEIQLNHQSMQITIPNSMLQALDPQCNQIWVYLFGGWLDAYYRFAVLPASVNQGMTIDELATPAGDDLDQVYERTRIPTWGFTYSQLNSSGIPEYAASTDINVTLRTSELEALTGNVRLEPYLVVAPDNIIDIAGPYQQRLWVLVKEGYLFPSTLTSPTIFNSYQQLDLTLYGRVRWLAQTGNAMYVGCEKDVVMVMGDGSEGADRTRANLYLQPLNVSNPPVDKCHWREGNSVIYRSADGLMELTGGSIQPIPTAGTSLLWRGKTRHGVQPLNVDTGRFRCTVDHRMFYMIAPEGSNTSGNTIYRYSLDKQTWSRLVFDQITNIYSIFSEPSGRIVIGDGSGNLWAIDSGTQDDSNDIAFYRLTPFLDGGNPLSYKDPMDYQVHMYTGGSTVEASIILDDAGTPYKTFNLSSTAQGAVHRESLDNTPFIRAQIQISGGASEFTLSNEDLSYRVRPQRMVKVDTGYFLPQDPEDWIWITEIEVDAIVASSTFTVKLYFNDSLWWTSDSITATTGKRDVYQIPVPRGSKGERARIVIETSDTSGTGDIGIDPYFIRVRTDSTGNQDLSRRYMQVWPTGSAP